MGVDPFCSDADLTGVGKCRSIDFPGHLCDIDVVKHDAGVVSAEFERYPLEGAGGAFENLLPRRGRACERDLGDIRMRCEQWSQVIHVGQYVEHASREDILRELSQHQRRSEEHTSELQSLMRNSYA